MIEHVGELDPKQFLGIPLALVGAGLLAFGAQYQSRGLNKVERIVGESAGSGLSWAHVRSLLTRPSWVVGTVLLGLAVLFQIGSLALSPLIIVQPIGVAGLIITSILNSRMSGVHLGKRVRASLGLAVLGIVAFVTIAAFTARDQLVTDAKLTTILVTYGVVLVLAFVLFIAFRHRGYALMYIVGAGVLYGFVATFAKAVIGRLQQGEFEWLTWACVAALLVGALLGMVFVQNAYSSGPPDLVVAGLTVIDPIVAVLIGIVVLHEAAGAPAWAVVAYVLSGVIAVIGVVGLARFHPQAGGAEQDAPVPLDETLAPPE
ncbi:multidrug DMT transporter permease [Leucobacter chromiireducens]|uniref:Multidrug DMT transporter permease n=1 Tax=Leucobacter chromiireducens subsp. solipictus TaxID=398235 RepID=A0ABS1SGA4_9MICO|nr:multidrug DMT transporter permease [Leucobacter chromiireducens]MBL3679446.1 multidrug DMT transporter permease [Leucobacter chromiireducens subsp. solipictus]